MIISNAFILGSHVQALGLSRFAKENNLNVSIFSDTRISVARFSNSCDSFVLYSSLSNLLEYILKVPSSFKNKKTLLIATDDALIDFLVQHYDVLNKDFVLAISEPKIVDICYNKRKTYQFAESLNIPIPKSYFPDSIQELEVLADKIDYPILIKPAVVHTFYKGTGKKMFLCSNKKELVEKYNKTIAIIPKEEVILQEFLSAGAKVLFSYGSFAGNGKVYGSFCANRIRQNPMDFGKSTCFALTVTNQKFENNAKLFLEKMNYFGMSEVEFMYDEKIDDFKLLEINPRAWKWHYIAKGLNIDLMKMMLNYLQNKPITEKHNKIENFAWIESITDSYISIKEILKGKLSIKEYIRTLKLKKNHAIWSFSDPLPGLFYVLSFPVIFFKRN